MGVIEVIAGIEGSSLFKQWKKENPEAYLTSAFAMFSSEQEKEWLIGYYDDSKQAITTFGSNGMEKSEEAFTKEGAIPELKLDNVKLSEEEALEKAADAKEKEYGSEKETKTIMVLQNIEGKTVWNITYIAKLKVINVRIDASEGETVSHSSSSISDFMQMS